ncbi:hypothetical protein F2Q69_00040937 [Brassica cretica]|uniref:Uncharacterized protein n=1 Tax=Brassica cretica TaxID=69181 RepID=A0A8S9NU47_BRACR|nr:hypothetical protein F2Q69_00040937 [Brassica cretica]
MKALTVPNSLRFGEALLSKPATLEMPATGVQYKTEISTFRGFMNFPNWKFSSLSIREYKTSKGDYGPRKKRPEPKPIFHEQKDKHDHFPRRASNDIVPHASGMKLWLEPWPDDRFYRTGLCLPRPVLHSKINGQARFEFERVDFELVRATSFLASLDCTGRVLTLSAEHAEDSLNLDISRRVSLIRSEI